VYRKLLSSDEAKKNCIDLMSSVLADKVDGAIVLVMSRTQDLVIRGEITFEITPATSPDAYGGWWISAYSEKSLDSARASEKELEEIAVKRAAAEAPPAPRAAPRQPAAPRVDLTPAPPSFAAEDNYFGTWSTSDLSYARAASSNSSSGSGRVYVRGYYRKDGTYVRPHTRSR
jgi:hypothetical protein